MSTLINPQQLLPSLDDSKSIRKEYLTPEGQSQNLLADISCKIWHVVAFWCALAGYVEP